VPQGWHGWRGLTLAVLHSNALAALCGNGMVVTEQGNETPLKWRNGPCRLAWRRLR